MCYNRLVCNIISSFAMYPTSMRGTGRSRLLSISGDNHGALLFRVRLWRITLFTHQADLKLISDNAAPSEYDIISRFQNFVLLSTIVHRESTTGTNESQARRHCEILAFEVVCASIHHYKACTSHLNSETFE